MFALTKYRWFTLKNRHSYVLDMEKIRVRQAIQGISLDEIRRDEALTHFNLWAVLLVKMVNQTNE